MNFAAVYQLLWIFFVYAFLGWCVEVSFVALQKGHFVNRGFLNGPVCPIYGFGVIIVLACLTPLKENFVILFLGSVVLTSILEWTTGFVLEKLFRQRWWDYSNEPFNLNGYICLRYSIMWGLACVLVVDVLHPSIMTLIGLIPRTLGTVLLCLMGAVLAVDLGATLATVTKMRRRLDAIDELAAKIKELSSDFGEDLADRVLDAAGKGADFKAAMEAWAAEQAEDLGDLREDVRERRAALLENVQEHREERQRDAAERRDTLLEDARQRKEELATDVQERREELQNLAGESRRQLQELSERLREQLDSSTAGQRRLIRAFPDLKSLDRSEALNRLHRKPEQDRK